MDSHNYVTIIGTNYLQPITSLLEELVALDSSEPTEVQAGVFDNGYSAAIIVLTVLLLESAINSSQYILNLDPPMKPVEFVRETFPKSDFGQKLEELFVARDVIAHNHVWEAEIAWDGQGAGRLKSAQLRHGFGDKKYRRVTRGADKKTTWLGIDLFPTRISQRDAIIVLKTAVDFLLYLETQDRVYFLFSHEYVKYGGSLIPFVDLVAGL